MAGDTLEEELEDLIGTWGWSVWSGLRHFKAYEGGMLLRTNSRENQEPQGKRKG